jgi:hypothetical protein
MPKVKRAPKPAKQPKAKKDKDKTSSRPQQASSSASIPLEPSIPPVVAVAVPVAAAVPSSPAVVVDDDDDALPCKIVTSLHVNDRSLNAETELRRMFGSATIDEAIAERTATRLHPSDPRSQRPSLASLRARIYCTVTVRAEWPKVDLPMTMKLLKTANGVPFFRLKWKRAYRKLQRLYFECVNSGDPNAVHAVLREQPFHMDSLLQLANLSVRASDMPNAADYCERVLYAFEAVRHASWSFDGTCRLLYAHEENRPVHHAVFRYIHLLGRRGCQRTAFEYCKLLLSFDPSDPLAILALADYFAIRSKQFSALDRVFNDAALAHHQLDLLVNWSYTAALAAFRRRAATTTTTTGATGPDPDVLLQRALLTFPHAIVELLSRNGKAPDGVLQHPFFALDTTHLPSLQHLVKLFAERNHDLWRGADIVKWVLANAAVVLEQSQSNPDSVRARESVVDEHYEGDYNHFSHLSLTDFSDHIDQLPEDVAAQLRNGARMYANFRAVGPRRVRVDPRMTAIGLFLRTLFMPWLPTPNAPAVDSDDESSSDDDGDDNDKKNV